MNHVLDTRLCVMFSRFCRDRSSCVYLIDGSFYLNAEALSDWKDGGKNKGGQFISRNIFIIFFTRFASIRTVYMCASILCIFSDVKSWNKCFDSF